MKILYKPFGILAGILAARLARRIFRALWGTIDGDAPPKANVEHTSTAKAIGAAAFEAATYAATRAAVDRAGLKWFHFVTGIWAGEKDPKPEKK